MPDRKSVFLELKSILETVPDLSGKVYSAYPKKKINLPFAIIKTPAYSEEAYTLDDSVYSYAYEYEIHIYAKTAQKVDELTDLVISTLRSSDVYNAQMSINALPDVEAIDDMEVYHVVVLTILLQW